jgi:ribose transport system ATP-binding protein
MQPAAEQADPLFQETALVFEEIQAVFEEVPPSIEAVFEEKQPFIQAASAAAPMPVPAFAKQQQQVVVEDAFFAKQQAAYDSTADGETLLYTRGLVKIYDGRTVVNGVDIEVRRGEIVGLCGLVGSGRSEVARAIFGADPVTSGEIIFDGKTISGEPDLAARRGIALIPESRKSEGLALLRSVGDNLVVSALRKLFPSGLFDQRRAQRTSDGLIRQLRIATPSARQIVGLLSGGNQQKVVIGKWLAAGSKLFIFDEPTRGIDIGAKAEIYALVRELTEQGLAVVLVSSELPELIGLADRILMLCEGQLGGSFDARVATQAELLSAAMSKSRASVSAGEHG